MNQSDIAWTLAFIKRDISEAEFLDKLGWSTSRREDCVIQLLEQALIDRDADAVEMGLLLAHRMGLNASYSNVFCRLLAEKWHIKHEDLAFALGKLKANQAVEALFAASQANHEYLAYDDGQSLAAKCIRALERIATPEALIKLREMATSENEFIRVEAGGALARQGE